MTRVRRLDARQAQLAGWASCFGLVGPMREGTRAVERSGVDIGSLTFLQAGARYVGGCTRSARRSEGRRLCGSASGLLRHGRVLDPRVTLLCVDAGGRPVATAWIEPSPQARWLVVRDLGREEIYPVSPGLPVRVASHAIDTAQAAASFAVEEVGPDGRAITRRLLRAQVAG